MPKFTTSLDKTNVGAADNQEVILSFSSEDLVDEMPVTLELDGLKPKNGLPTKAVTRYVYTVDGTGTQTITLVTTESTTSSKTCSIQLKAEGFESSSVLEVVQSNTVTYSGKNIKVTYSANRPDVSGGSGSSTYSAQINTIKVNDKEVNYEGSASYTYSYNPGTLTITLDSISITDNNLDSSSVVEFECTITRKKGTTTGTRTEKFTKTIGELGLTISK